MTPFLMGKQEGWDMAMRFISTWCSKAQASVDKAGPHNISAFEEIAILTKNLVQTEPKEFS